MRAIDIPIGGFFKEPYLGRRVKRVLFRGSEIAYPHDSSLPCIAAFDFKNKDVILVMKDNSVEGCK